jgi:GxxExxY protein
MLVEDGAVVELKALETLDSVHTAQCINHLKTTDLRLCLRLNFRKPRVKIHW